MSEHLDVFGIDVIVPDPRERYAWPEVRPLINGTDFIESYVGAFSCGDARGWLVPDGPFRVGDTPHTVEMATACGCHFPLSVTMRREGDTVVWECEQTEGGDIDSYDFRFDAAQYDAEVARAAEDFSWEWPSLTVARVLGDLLRARTDWLADRSCDVGQVWSPPGNPDEVRLFFTDRGPGRDDAPVPLKHFGTVRPVTGEDPVTQAERLARELMANDPREVEGMLSGTYADVVLNRLGTGFELSEPNGYKW